MEKSVSRTGKPRVLLVLHLPPPVHGPSQAGAFLRESALLNDTFRTRYVNLSGSAKLEEVGHFSVRKILRVFRLFGEVRRVIRAWKPDLVYLTPSATLPGVLKDAVLAWMVRRMGVRVLLHLHNKGVASSQDSVLFNALYLMLFRDSHVILLSGLLYPDVSRYVPETCVSYLPNGVDVPSVPRTAGPVPRLLFLSNILRSKGVSVLVDACEVLRGRGIVFHCSMVGALSADYPGESLAEEIRSKGVDDCIDYLGPRYGDSKWEAFAQADVFVHPTLSDCFPLAVLEAMGTGLPVVTTDEGALPEIIRDGVEGLVCPKGDARVLADALERLVWDTDLRARMGENARARYLACYTQGRFEQRFVEILQQQLHA